MGLLDRILAKIRELPSKMGGFLPWVRELPSKPGRLPAFFADLWQRRRKTLLVGAGISALFLFLIITVLVSTAERRSTDLRSANAGSPAQVSDLFRPQVIPPEELFLPDEPDFLPPVLLEREQREFWTAEDARPFWWDPLDVPGGSETYLDQITSVIDELMEHVL
jgi:hypothetical protein